MPTGAQHSTASRQCGPELIGDAVGAFRLLEATVPHIATHYKDHIGTVVGDGHCVAFVRKVAKLPHTSKWRRGEHVRGTLTAAGTAIATFDDNGRYGNHVDGSSHAAIFLTETDQGLLAIDQWVRQPVHQRLIRFRGGHGRAVNDGDRYYVIEVV